MPARKGLLAPQNTFLDTIATRFDGTHSNFVLGNAKITKVYPIVYCSDGFCELTGYSRAQIMQKSCACNFLYGAKTDGQHRSAISEALESKQELKLEVILYRSSGTPFWCLLDIVPIQDEKHEVVLFLCSHKDITKQKLHEQQQKVAAAAALHQQQLQHINEHQLQLQQSSEQQQQHHHLQANHSDLSSWKSASALLDPSQTTGTGGNKLHQLSSDGSQQLNRQQQQRHSSESLGGELAAQRQQNEADYQASQLQQLQQLQQQEHDDQQALISMEEFCIDELDGDDDQLDEQDDDDHDKHTASQYSRRRSRAVLYQLSGHYGYRRSVNMKSKLKLNNRMTIPEYKTTTIEKQRFILSHYGLGKSCWDWLILIVSFYVAIVVPYNATFKEKALRLPNALVPLDDDEYRGANGGQSPSGSTIGESIPSTFDASNSNPTQGQHLPPSLSSNQSATGQFMHSGGGGSYYEDNECEIDSIDIFVEIVFIIDVILNFRTTFVNRKGEVVTRPKIICRHYVRGWFVVDACAALPFDLLCGLNLYSRSRLKVDLNLLKLIRLLRLARLLQKMDRYSQYSYIILTLLMLIFSLLAHWCACIWYVIAMEEIERHPPEWKLGWIHQLSDKLGYNVVNATDMASSYVTALYFTTSSLTSVGFGNVSANTNAEKIFSIVIMLIGALMHAVVFGNVTALIRVMYARRSNYQTRLRDLKDFFRLHQLPKDLQQRMSDYFQTTWSLNHGIDTYEILKDFPEELCGDVSLHLHREVLSLPIFASAPQGFLKSLARHIESKFCCPTEYLIHRGDALGYLYLVCNGSMEVLQDNMVVGILGKGDLVGYDVNTILSANEHQSSNQAASGGSQYNQGLNKMLMSGGLVKSSSDLKALTYCDLKCIHIGGLLEVLKLYPEFSDTFHEEIIHDLSFNLREQHEDQADEEDEEDEEEEVDDEDDGEGDSDDGHADDDNDNDDDDHGNGGGADGGNQNGGEDDDDDEDEDDDDGGEGQVGGQDKRDGHDDDEDAPGGGDGVSGGRRRQGPSRPPPAAPPSSANRAINGRHAPLKGNENQGHEPDQIGRYDYDDVDMGARGRGTLNGDDSIDDIGEEEEEEGQDEEGPDEEDEDDDDDDDELDDGPDGVATESEQENCGDDGRLETRGRPRAANGSSSSRPSTAGRRGRPAAVKQSSWDDLSGHRAVAKSRFVSAGGVDDDAVGGGSLDDAEEALDRYETALDGSRRYCRRPTTVKRLASTGERSVRSGKSFAQRQSTTLPAHLSHSYDGLTAVAGASGGTKEDKPIGNSSIGSKLNDQLTQPQRLKPAIGLQQSNRASKPPISFDLSRNTTAIVDRRRRSAGCIQRLTLISGDSAASGKSGPQTQVGPPGSNGPANRRHTSLIHINENEPMGGVSRIGQVQASGLSQQRNPVQTGQFVPGARRRARKSIERLNSTQSQQSQVSATSGVSESSCQQGQSRSVGNNIGRTRLRRVQTSYSNQDLKQIDAHITASVRKLRQEFKLELNNAIESLARLMLERNNSNSSSNNNSPNCWSPRLSRQQQQQQQQQATIAAVAARRLAQAGARRPLAGAQSVCSLTSGDSSTLSVRTATGVSSGVKSRDSAAATSAVAMSNLRRRKMTAMGAVSMSDPAASVQDAPLERSASTVSLLRAQLEREGADERVDQKQAGVERRHHQAVVALKQQASNWPIMSQVSCNASSQMGTSTTLIGQHQQSLDQLGYGPSSSGAISHRPVSQCSMSPPLPLAPSSSTSSATPAVSGQLANNRQQQSAIMLNVNSDNDSGRSTSSVNSSGVAAAASSIKVAADRGIHNQPTQGQPTTTGSQMVPGPNGGCSSSNEEEAAAAAMQVGSGSMPTLATGRAAKLLVKTRDDGSQQQVGECYTIDIQEGHQQQH